MPPSHSLKVQIDPRMFQYKDMAATNFTNNNAYSYLNPVESAIGCEISLDTAEGVSLPKEFKPEMVVRRVVRVGLYDKKSQRLTFNTATIQAGWTTNEKG